MAIEITVGCSPELIGASQIEWLAAAAQTGRATVVVDSPVMRDALRSSLAQAGVVLGVEVLSISSWIEALWALDGDGKKIVDRTERRLLMGAVVEQAAAEQELTPLRKNPGTIRLLCRMARELLAYREQSDEVFEGAERAVVRLLERYAQALAQRELIELCQASARLAVHPGEAMLHSAQKVMVLATKALEAYELELMSALSAASDLWFVLPAAAAGRAESLREVFGALGAPATVQMAPGDVSKLPAPQRFLEVMGPHARAHAYAQQIQELAATTAAAPVVVASARPSACFAELAPYLAARGLVARVNHHASFGQTELGRRFLGLRALLERMRASDEGDCSCGVWWPAPELTDWLYSPFSGIDRAQVRIFDRQLRRHRAWDAQAVMRELQRLQARQERVRKTLDPTATWASVPAIGYEVVRLLWHNKPLAALRVILDLVRVLPTSAWGAAGRVGARCALEAAQLGISVLQDQTHALRVPSCVALDALSEFDVRYSESMVASQSFTASEVLFMTIEQAAAYRAAPEASLFCADVDIQSYPLSTSDDACDALAAKLNARRWQLEPAAHLRNVFAGALAACPSASVFARVTHTSQAKDSHPAAIWTEVLTQLGDAAQVVRADESDIVADLDLLAGSSLKLRQVSCYDPQVLSPAARRVLVLRQRSSQTGELVARKLSASQIEAYLACPLCWFVSSRLRPDRIDAGFGGMEQGNFVHDVLERLHERLRDGGQMRVTPENLEGALGVLHEVFAEVRAEHAEGKTTTSGALVALFAIQDAQIDAILPQLEAVVRYEAEALAPFVPTYLEYAFDNEGARFAGWPLGGRIDRVDVDAEGRAVIIDYKFRSKVDEYRLTDPTVPGDGAQEGLDLSTWMPAHTQALIYAQALRSALHLDVRGALYFSVKGYAPALRGAISAELAEQEPHDGRVPGLKQGFPDETQGGTMSFEELLACVEQGVEERLKHLAAGEIAAAAVSSTSCIYNHRVGFTRRNA